VSPSAVLRWLIVLAPLVAGANPIFDRTTEWREQVALRTGEAIVVERSLTFGPDEWFRPGRGILRKQSASFRWQGRSVSWSTEEAAFFSVLPITLDIVDGAPVIVLPIRGWRACQAYDYPLESLAAFRERDGKWTPVGLKTLPPDLRVNLLQNYSFRPEGSGVVSVRQKQELDRIRYGDTPNGATLQEVSVAFGKHDSACRRMRPTPDPVLDAALLESVAAEKAATRVVADLTSSSTAPEVVSAADVRANMGQWHQVAWITDSCRDAVLRAEPQYHYDITPGSMRSNLVGYVIHLVPESPQARIGLTDSHLALSSIACDERTIVVVRRDSGERVLLDRFDRAGKPIDATWVEMPRAAEFSRDGKLWAPVWNVSVSGPKVAITLADYDYPQTMNLGGMLRKKAVYEVRLAGK